MDARILKSGFMGGRHENDMIPYATQPYKMKMPGAFSYETASAVFIRGACDPSVS